MTLYTKSQIEGILEIVKYEELTLAIYRLGRLVVGEILPDQLINFPEYGWTLEQEQELLIVLAKLQSGQSYGSYYQNI